MPRNYYGKDKVISRFRLGTTIDELNDLLDKSVKVLSKAKAIGIKNRESIFNEIDELLWLIEYKREDI
tara:strand:- start:42 stop:245 length:204 start_codon:yes stop_codon:yes gene_type:complete